MRTSPLLVSLLLLSLSTSVVAQPKYNLNFEQSTSGQPLPEGWIKWGMYPLNQDTTVVHSGKRSIGITSNAPGNAFGSVAYKLPATYQGDSITLEGYMKLAEVDGFAGLLLRVDGNGQPLAFDNMQQRKIDGTIDWQKYRVTLELPANAEAIFVAGILVGKGKAWFDDFRVLIDGEDIQTRPEVAIALPPARLDTAFDAGSDVVLDTLSARQQENLFALGKVWGFLKYHHPEVARGNLNWDYELLRILPAASDEAFSERLAAWIPPVPKNSQVKTIIDPTNAVKLPPPTDWFDKAPWLGEKVREALEGVEAASVPESHYYLSFVNGVGNPVFQNEDAYPRMAWADDGFKLLALFRYWNMIEYWFPYRHLMDADWDEVLREFIPRMTAADDERSYKLALLDLIGRIQDTHANIWQADSVLMRYHGERAVPVKLSFVEDQPVVVRTFDLLDSGATIGAGDVIIEIDGRPVREVVAEKSAHAPASNRPTQLRDVARRLLRTNESRLSVTFKNERGTFREEIPTVDLKEHPLNFGEVKVASHRELPGDVGYIYPGTLAPGEIDSIMTDFRDKKGLVIDLRCYPSQFIVFDLGKYLMPKPTEFAKFTFSGLEQPGQFVFTDPLEVGEKRADYFKGKVVILVNEITQSQAEYTTMALRVAPQATVMGSTTAGADGNVSQITLPGSVNTSISGIGVYYPDGTETQRVGIVPDIEMHPTIDGMRAGRDELLERAIELVGG